MTRALFALAALAASPVSHACGGFFCSNVAPVNQKSEGILFAVDEEAGKVEMHVQVEYEGPAEEFAWVVPVQANPELAIGTSALFPLLAGAGSVYALDRHMGSDCFNNYYGGTGTGTGTGTGSSFSTADGSSGVVVVAKQDVGPYETVTLQATSSAALITWLGDNGFDLPAALDPVLAPYVAADSYFVALRLGKNSDAGDLEPLVLRYDGTKPAIPIQLTSVAATPDMRLNVYVLGDHRAVPESYLHVQVNHLAIDWWRGGTNLDDAIGRAADEAGGHAFYTDYSGPVSAVAPVGSFYRSSWESAGWDQAIDGADLLDRVVTSALPLDSVVMGLLSDHLGIPEETAPGLDLLEALNCVAAPYYFSCDTAALNALTVDAVAFADDLEVQFLEPRRRISGLLTSGQTLTRMTSSLSPAEMTVDPTFVFNPDMGPVDRTRRADETWLCELADDRWDAPRVLDLADGRSVDIPPQSWLWDHGLTEFEWLELSGLTVPVAAIIERTGPTGQPEILVDNRDLLDEQTAAGNRPGTDDPSARGAGGCGCSSTAPSPTWLALLPLAVGLRRRR